MTAANARLSSLVFLLGAVLVSAAPAKPSRPADTLHATRMVARPKAAAPRARNAKTKPAGGGATASPWLAPHRMAPLPYAP